jgi:hypothetical protein
MARRWLVAAIIMLAIVGGYVLVRRAERVESRLLRTGGRAIQMLAQRPTRTLTIFALGVGLLWGGIGLLSVCEARRVKTAASRKQPPEPEAGQSTVKASQRPD